MKYNKPSGFGSIKEGSYFVKFESESMDDCLGSYGAEPLDSGDVRVCGHDTLDRALLAAEHMRKNHPSAQFEILDCQLRPVKL